MNRNNRDFKIYYDFEIIDEVPNKYNLTIDSIKKLKILDWEALKKATWYNVAMKSTGTWYCHIEGCNKPGRRYDDFSEFWIGFREEDNKIDCHFSTYEGMCNYVFDEFYKEIENEYDLMVQVNTLRFVNKLIDEKVLGL